MINTGKLAGQTLFITGASRGIGKAIALKAAKDGANIVIAAKTATAHPKLKGTIYTAAEEVEKAGGKCLPCIVDVREEGSVLEALENAVKKFGGIDILVNNASAISLTNTSDTAMKKYDLMNSVNVRGTFLASKCCLPYLKKSKNPHILNLSPPLDMQSMWFKNHVAYTIAKFGMSLCVLGMSEEFKSYNIAVNALWPKTAISTAAMEMLGGEEVGKHCRIPEIISDAAYAILIKDSKTTTGNFFIDEHVLRNEGIKDFDQYAVAKGEPLLPDFFIPQHVIKEFPEVSQSMISYLSVDSDKAAPSSSTESSASAASSGADTSELGSLFGELKKKLNEQLVKQIGGTFAFSVKGTEDMWYLDLKNGAGSVGKGQHPSGKSDVSLVSDDQTFVQIFSGKTKPTSAFMSGKLKLKGDMALAMKLEKLLKSKL